MLRVSVQLLEEVVRVKLQDLVEAAAWFVVVGYATVIFNFTGVNLLFLGLHSYSGL